MGHSFVFNHFTEILSCAPCPHPEGESEQLVLTCYSLDDENSNRMSQATQF